MKITVTRNTRWTIRVGTEDFHVDQLTPLMMTMLGARVAERVHQGITDEDFVVTVHDDRGVWDDEFRGARGLVLDYVQHVHEHAVSRRKAKVQGQGELL